MKKSFRKYLLLMAVITLLFTCFVTTAFAATDINGSKCEFTYTSSDSTATLTKCTSTSQTWKLPSSVSCKVGSKYPYFTVTNISGTFFLNSSYAKYVTYLRLPSTLTTIPNGLFQSGVNYLKTLEIYGANTDCSDYFLGCNALEEFVVNENNAVLSAIDGVLYKGATLMRFPSAKALTDTTAYEVPANTDTLRGYSFYKVKNLTDIKVPATVTTIGSGAFCSSSITGVHFENGSTYDFTAYNCTCGECATKITFCLEDEESIEATCSQTGHTAGLRCDITGEWFSGEEIPMADHDYNGAPTQTEPTCKDNAKRIFECAYGCGTKKEVELADTALGHKGGTATCTALAVCETCKEEYGVLDADNHSFTSYTYNNDAECKKDGTKTAVCDNGCGKSHIVSAEKTALGHSYTSYNVIKKATCENNAIESALCDNGCGLADIREVKDTAIGHFPSTPVKTNVVAATCKTDGSYTEVVTCNSCNTTLSTVNKVVPATGHADANGDNVCDNGGEVLRSPADDCTHMCHKSGFMGFIWKIVRFFTKLFKINPVCNCGVAHY